MRFLIAVAAMTMLAGCATSGSQFQSRAVGVGGGPNHLKRTPCACVQVDQPAGLPDFLIDSTVLQSKAHG